MTQPINTVLGTFAFFRQSLFRKSQAHTHTNKVLGHFYSALTINNEIKLWVFYKISLNILKVELFALVN